MSDFAAQLELLSPKDGDVLVVKNEQPWTYEEWDRIRKDFNQWTASLGIRVYLMGVDSEISVHLEEMMNSRA